MPPIRDHDMAYEEVEEDDEMPPLVDNPNPSMTFTFFTDMRPITFSSTEPTSFEVLPEPSTFSSPPASPSYPEDNPASSPTNSRVSHGKKRDASYIPRPPNAFILFRSSFIKSQQVPGKVEGNHSTLSKIIGMYWKTLPREEREQWEAKAVIAQAEHRKKYPDWRFRPGANAMAKLKVKDGPGTSRKRYHQTRKGKEETDGNENSMEQRCAKIADLLVEGKTGSDLEAAVKEWEGGRISSKDKYIAGKSAEETRDGPEGEEQALEGRSEGDEPESPEVDVKVGPDGGVATGEGPSNVKEQEGAVHTEADSTGIDDGLKTRSRTPDSAHDGRFKVPLTSMFRRSLSAPASHTRCPCPDITPSPSAIPTHMRRDTVSLPVTTTILHQPPYGPVGYPRNHEASVRRDNVNDALDFLLSSRSPPITFVDGGSTRWSDPLTHHCLDVPVPVSLSTTSGFSYDTASPDSSSSTLQELYTVQVPANSDPLSRGEREREGTQAEDLAMTYAVYRYTPYSSYSTLQGWDGDDVSRRNSSGARRSSFTFPSSPPLEGPAHFAEAWTESGATTNASPTTSPHVSSSYRIDPSFGWYGPGAGTNRTLGPMRHFQGYPAGVNNNFGVDEPANVSASENEGGSDNYVFSFSNPPL